MACGEKVWEHRGKKHRYGGKNVERKRKNRVCWYYDRQFFGVASLKNNHMFDYGQHGFDDTNIWKSTVTNHRGKAGG